MRRKRHKGYWVKKSEPFRDGAEARSRAGVLRANEDIAHVTVRKLGSDYVVSYSVAQWYVDELEKAGLKL